MSNLERNVEQIAARMGIPVEEWPGKCHEVSLRALAAGVVEGTARYGLWTGTTRPGSQFYGRPFTGHGWIELSDGRIYDLTRWAFEMVPPYVYIGPNDCYDTTGDGLREGMQDPPPPYQAAARTVTLDLLPETAGLVLGLLGNPPGITDDMCWWLANCPRKALGAQARDLFAALIAAGYTQAIPIDNRMYFGFD